MSRPDRTVGDRRMAIAVSLAAALLIFAPAIFFVARGPGHNTENRTQANYRGLDAGWDVFAAFGDYVADRLPLKTSAVRADAWIDEHVYREDPAFGGAAVPRVVRGKDGFLFLADALDVACTPPAPAASAVANLNALMQAIDDSGREVLTMIAPDKSSIHPELMPDEFGQKECWQSFTDELWAGMSDADIPDYVDLRAALIAESTASREPLYLRKDSHWDSAGSLVAVRAMVEHFAPGLWSEGEVEYKGLVRYTGDMTNMQGKPEEDDAPLYAVVRPDITNVSIEVFEDSDNSGVNRRFVNTGPPGRLIEGRTVMFYDSFGIAAMPQIVPYFADLTVIRFVDYDPQRFLDLIEGADRVWFMSNERSLFYRMEFEIGSPAFVELLHQQLTHKS